MFRFFQEVVHLLEDRFRFRRFRERGNRRHPGGGCRLPRFSQDFAANLALDNLGIVVGAAHRTENQVEDVLFLGLRRFRFRLEFRGATRTARVSAGNEAAAVRADEEESNFALLEDAIRIAVPQLGRMAEACFE